MKNTILISFFSAALLFSSNCKNNKPVPMSDIQVEPPSLTLKEGETGRFKATAIPENASDKQILWKSDNEEVAIVSIVGTVTAVGEGTTTVTASSKDGAVSREMTVTVAKATGEFPIVAWMGKNGEITRQMYKDMRDAGIDYFIISWKPLGAGLEQQETITEMDKAQECGLKMLFHVKGADWFINDIEAGVRALKDHPGFGGYQMYDEPAEALYPDIKAQIESVRRTDKTHDCYVMINGDDDEANPNPEGFRNEVEKYAQELPGDYLAYDNYPLRVQVGGARRILNYWFDNLGIMADVAKSVGKPFRACVQSSLYWDMIGVTLTDLRIQVYTYLAYGAQGIEYFTWFDYDDFVQLAPVNFPSGEKTYLYDNVKAMNSEIRTLSKVFWKATALSVKHTGATIPRGTSRLETLPSNIESFETVGTGAVVSLMEKENSVYWVIVNRDPNYSMTVNIKVKPGVQKILKEDASSVPVGDEPQRETVAPGDVLIYTWEKVEN
ncbi:MAG: Ig-like domain-containing protein [Bacteroidales bacterium]|jgi:hypothetical protein|nr:Ig-like domain-containing protein [Bacteroidales bacterium]